MKLRLFNFPVCISCLALMGCVSYSQGIGPKYEHSPSMHLSAITSADHGLYSSTEKVAEKDIYGNDIVVTGEQQEKELSVFRMVANDPFSR